MADRGVLYIAATRPETLAQVCHSVVSLRDHYDGPVTIITDQNPLDLSMLVQNYDVVVEYKRDGDPHGKFASRRFKTRMYELSPYEETLFIDTDTLVFKAIGGVWSHLANADIAMMKLSSVKFSSAVTVFRKSHYADAFFRSWYGLWRNRKKEDEPHIPGAVARSGTSIAPLDNKYNQVQVVLPKTVILHGKDGSIFQYYKLYPSVNERVREVFFLESDEGLW